MPCERLHSYLIGLQFTIETNHKPLLTLLGTKALDDLALRIQRFHLRLLRFQYNIVHIPDKALITAVFSILFLHLQTCDQQPILCTEQRGGKQGC